MINITAAIEAKISKNGTQKLNRNNEEFARLNDWVFKKLFILFFQYSKCKELIQLLKRL